MKKKKKKNVVKKTKKRRTMVVQLMMTWRTSSILSILHITILRKVVFINVSLVAEDFDNYILLSNSCISSKQGTSSWVARFAEGSHICWRYCKTSPWLEQVTSEVGCMNCKTNPTVCSRKLNSAKDYNVTVLWSCFPIIVLLWYVVTLARIDHAVWVSLLLLMHC